MNSQKFHDEVMKRKVSIYKERYKDACLSKINLPEYQSKVLYNFLKTPENILVYLGNSGIGKTYFCAALTEWAMRRMESFRYYKESDFLSSLREHIQKSGGGDYTHYLEMMCDDDLVILDDVGSSGVNQWREEVFFSFLDYRYNSMKPTIVTSNFLCEDFERKYSPRVASRLFASENFVLEIKDGVDLRAQGY